MVFSDLTHWLAAVVIAGELTAIAAVAWIAARRSYFKPSQWPVYLFGVCMTRLLWRAKVVGSFEMPPGAGAVIVCNHRGPIDPAFIGLASRRSAHWMVAREYFRVPVFGGLLKFLEAVPTGRRGIDTAAIKQMIRYARRGDVVGVFPEGRINTTDAPLLPCRSGAALIALEARVPIIPCYIVGSPHDKRVFYKFLFKSARTVLTVGKPIDLSAYYERAHDRSAQDEIMQRVVAEMLKLAKAENFEPALAGRRRRVAAPAETPVVNAATIR